MLPSVLFPKGFSYRSRVLKTLPVHYLPLDDLSSVVVLDYGSTPEVLSVTGATLAQAPAPGGILAPYFDSVNDYVSRFGYTFNYDVGTVMMWAKVYDVAEYLSDNVALDLNSGGGTHILFRFTGNGVLVQDRQVATNTLNWMQIAFTWDKGANEQHYYFNGAEQGAPAACNVVIASTWAISLACFQLESSFFHGWLSHLVMWQRQLTAAQISSLYIGG